MQLQFPGSSVMRSEADTGLNHSEADARVGLTRQVGRIGFGRRAEGGGSRSLANLRQRDRDGAIRGGTSFRNMWPGPRPVPQRRHSLTRAAYRRCPRGVTPTDAALHLVSGRLCPFASNSARSHLLWRHDFGRRRAANRTA